ncbi:hypothetical protein FGIG_00356 [Fasciola gigantica]|uniref:Uncharacterized protein n=1 Tax=Fasciola gigantica TaxID=46835 RepID=A0A504YEY8_FASGI|nr:hypothetical protein FGIG_00356 [Fasciola gigantica]
MSSKSISTLSGLREKPEIRIDYDRSNSEKITIENVQSADIENIQTEQAKLIGNLNYEWESTVSLRSVEETVEPKAASVLEKQPVVEYCTQPSLKLGAEIETIHVRMPYEYQEAIVEETRRLCNEPGRLYHSLLGAKLQNFVKQRFGGQWHVLIVHGSYTMSYSCFRNRTFHFRYRKRTYIVWQIPSVEDEQELVQSW